jgi:CRP/FNR family transcriptional regulator
MDVLAPYATIFEPELLREIEKYGQPISAAAGDTILDIGQIVRTMPIILSGTVKVIRVDEDGKELLLYYVTAAESCAMTFTCCMQQFPSDIRAVAEEDVDMIAIPVQLMDQWLVKYPTWKSFVMRTIRNRFHELLRTIDQIAFQKLDERLVHYLKEKSRVTGSTLVNLSHEQIAGELATTRVVISRLLKTLENQGKVLLYRNQVKLLRDL